MGYWGYSAYQIFRVTPARMDSLLLGALVALAVRSAPLARPSRPGRLSAAAWLTLLVSAGGLIVMRLFTGPLDAKSEIVQIAYPFLIPLLYASILVLCLHIPAGSVMGALLTNPFFRVVAKYSYAIYLFHLFFGRELLAALNWMSDEYPAYDKLFAVLFIPVAFAVVFGAAALSWRCIEAPALRLKDRFFSDAIFPAGRTV
jgi:peptidoglycan/LPS O-acetylase OafA/YrhL